MLLDKTAFFRPPAPFALFPSFFSLPALAFPVYRVGKTPGCVPGANFYCSPVVAFFLDKQSNHFSTFQKSEDAGPFLIAHLYTHEKSQ